MNAEVSVLLVEDNPGDVTLIETYLNRADTSLLGSTVELLHEERLDAALESLCDEPVDVLLLDLGLPHSTGLDTLENVLRDGSDVPIVVLTGLDDQSTAIEAIKRGAQDYVTKDRLNGQLLVRTLRYAIERTETRRELERQNQRLEQFASVLSHDIRNPLNIANGRLNLVREECDNDYLDDVAEMHDRMEQLVDDVLTLARKGQTVDEVRPVELEPIASNAWNTAGSEQATLRIEDDIQIEADGERLRTILENLFSNAVMHAGPQVTVTVGILADEEGFYVSDDGPGIPEDTRETVFESGYTTSNHGSGFGLRIVRDIAEAHGWSVNLASADSGGARFEFVCRETPI